MNISFLTLKNLQLHSLIILVLLLPHSIYAEERLSLTQEWNTLELTKSLENFKKFQRIDKIPFPEITYPNTLLNEQKFKKQWDFSNKEDVSSFEKLFKEKYPQIRTNDHGNEFDQFKQYIVSGNIFGDDFYINGPPTSTNPHIHKNIVIRNNSNISENKKSPFVKKVETNSYGTKTIPSYSGVAMILGKNGIIKDKDGTSSLALKKFSVEVEGNQLPLCDNENEFVDKKHVEDAYCTGFLSEINNEQVFITARHCIELEDQKSLLNSYVFFGFQFNSNNTFLNKFNSSQIFSFHSLIDAGKIDSQNIKYAKDKDFAILKLDRKVPNEIVKPLELDIDSKRNIHDHVVLVGHPRGFSQKIDYYKDKKDADKDEPRIEGMKENIIRVSTDSHSINSGSPILSAYSGKVIALMVFGTKDYKKSLTKNGVPCAESNQGDKKNTQELALDIKGIEYIKKHLSTKE